MLTETMHADEAAYKGPYLMEDDEADEDEEVQDDTDETEDDEMDDDEEPETL